MRRFLELIEQRGDVTLPARTFAARVGDTALAALAAERVIMHANRATSWPCDEIEDGCPRRIVENVGDAARPFVAVCGQRERVCEPVLLTEEECAQRAMSVAAFAQALRRLFRIDMGAMGEATPSTAMIALGAQRQGERTRDVVFVRRPSESAVASLLELREGAARPTLVLVPTCDALPASMVTRYRPGSHVEIVVLEDALRVRGGAIVVASVAPATESGVLAATAANANAIADGATQERVLVLPTIKEWSELRLYRIASQFISVRTPSGHVRATPIDFGMAHKYTRDPTEQWELLMEFLGAGGRYSGPPGIDSSTGLRKRVQRLQADLKRVFRLEEDPIAKYRPKVGWETKFRAFPDLPAD